MGNLSPTAIRLGARASTKHDAIRMVGEVLVGIGAIAPRYIESMYGREAQADTYLGNGIAIPHGKPEDRDLINETAIAVLQLPHGVDWNGQQARLVIGIAARSDEHIALLRRLTRVLGDQPLVERLSQTADPADLIEALTGERPTPTTVAEDLDHATIVAIPNPTGLHARPATALVGVSKGFTSELRLRYGNETADPRNLISLLQLGVPHGATVVVSARGGDAQVAVSNLAAAIASGLGEAEDDNEAQHLPTARDWAPRQFRSSITGIAASGGYAYGPIRLFRRQALVIEDRPSDRLEDASALQTALDAAHQELETLQAEVAARLGAGRAAIFAAHAELLNDPGLVREAIAKIFDGHGAAWAWQSVIGERVGQLQKLDDPILAGRAIDLSDVGQRVLRHLLGEGQRPYLSSGEPALLIADDLTPSDTASLDTSSVLGLATALGGPTSHTAIIARSIGLPALVGGSERLLGLADGTPAILDGFRGVLYLEPSEHEIATVQALQAGLDAEQAAAHAVRHLPATTSDGLTIEVAANVNRVADAERGVELGADGVGLMRTEFLFLERESAPSEEEQFVAYRSMVEALGGKPLIIRTLDIGGDKDVPYLNLPKEDNSFLGIRGIRLCLARPDLFAPQLRAIYRAAAYGPIKLMFPMIATLDDLLQAKTIAEQIRLDLNAPPLEIGIMVEVPSAAIIADHLAEEADFFSVGTNDLTQYVLAMDRLHPQLAKQADALHPAVLRMIARTVEAANARGRWVGVCGGSASDPLGAAILVGLGVRELSVSLPSIAQIKAHIRAASHTDLVQLAQRALACRSAEEVRAL